MLKELKDNGHEVFEIDRKIEDPFDTLKTVPWENITMVYHLGAITDTTEEDYDLLNRYNFEFSKDLITEALDRSIPVRYASSASVYGNTKDAYLLNPLNEYAFSKMKLDMWVRDQKEGDIIGLRYFNVYGSDESMKAPHTQSAVYKFIREAKTEGAFDLFEGSDKFFRDFVCIEDVVCVTMHVGSVPSPCIFDVGTGKPISIEKLALMVKDKYGANIRSVSMPDKLNKQYQVYTKAQNQIRGFRYVSVEEWLTVRDIKLSIA